MNQKSFYMYKLRRAGMNLNLKYLVNLTPKDIISCFPNTCLEILSYKPQLYGLFSCLKLWVVSLVSPYDCLDLNLNCIFKTTNQSFAKYFNLLLCREVSVRFLPVPDIIQYINIVYRRYT